MNTNIPVGLATKLGIVVSAVFGFVAALTAVLDGDHSQETILTMILAAATVIAVIGGRMGQAALDRLGSHLGPPKGMAIAPLSEAIATPIPTAAEIADELERRQIAREHAEAEVPPPHRPEKRKPIRDRPQA
jgi:hypothetical protein